MDYDAGIDVSLETANICFIRALPIGERKKKRKRTSS